MVASEGPPTRSGIARTIGHLYNGLLERGHQVELVAYPNVPRLVVGEVRLSGLLLQLPRLLARVNDYDIVNLHGAAPTLSDLFLLAARLRGLRSPLVYTHHCDIQVGSLSLLNRFYNRLHHGLTGAVASELVHTTHGYAAGIGVDDRTTVIPLGMEPRRSERQRRKDRRFTVLFVGQFRPYKGADVLLRAMAQVHGSRLIMAGHGPLEAELRQLADELGVDAEFHVGLDDEGIDRLYSRAHAIVLPSVTKAEAFGLVLVEGMAAGCVPVASDLPGVREVLGRIGFTFPVGSVHGLATTLRSLRDQPALVAQISDRARSRAATFTWEQTVADYERLFQSLLIARELRSRVQDPGADLDAALAVFTAQIAETLRAERAEVLVRTDSDALCRVAATGGLSSRVGERLEREIGSLGRYVVASSESVLVNSSQRPAGLPRSDAKRLGSAAGAPLVDAQGSFGTLLVRGEREFDRRDLGALTCIARHAAAALRSSASHEATAPMPVPLRLANVRS
jgi:rhamnosyl/mannosyltransferase